VAKDDLWQKDCWNTQSRENDIESRVNGKTWTGAQWNPAYGASDLNELIDKYSRDLLMTHMSYDWTNCFPSNSTASCKGFSFSHQKNRWKWFRHTKYENTTTVHLKPLRVNKSDLKMTHVFYMQHQFVGIASSEETIASNGLAMISHQHTHTHTLTYTRFICFGALALRQH
jgi:hypothetical protein